MSMGRANSKRRRDARYRRAVARQVAMVAAWQGTPRAMRADTYMPAPVEEFLRRGDTVDMFVDAEVDHSKCDNAWKPVQCDRCGARYVCTPSTDFYCAAEGDHCCEPCLLRGVGVPVISVHLIGGAR